MAKMRAYVPMGLLQGCRSSEVPLGARASNLIFGAPNVRRANGIVSTSFDLIGFVKRAWEKLTGKCTTAPVFAIDRIGIECAERLPRIWLSERLFNTKRDDGRRVFVESYPSGPDRGGLLALELGDRYLGEGLRKAGAIPQERIACFKAAEILYLHAVRRGNRTAASRLRRIYSEDLCKGDYWKTHLEARAKHARIMTPSTRLRLEH